MEKRKKKINHKNRIRKIKNKNRTIRKKQQINNKIQKKLKMKKIMMNIRDCLSNRQGLKNNNNQAWGLQKNF